MSVRFVCQMRGAFESGEMTAWQDSCSGHDKFINAVTCCELQSRTIKGERVKTPLMDSAKVELAAIIGDVAKEAGISWEHRIVKRTDEVVDHA